MSYMRGTYYIYRGGKDAVYFYTPSGAIELPQEIFDELVVMRHAQLTEDKATKKTESRAMKKWNGNLGCNALLKKHGRMGDAEQWDEPKKVQPEHS